MQRQKQSRYVLLLIPAALAAVCVAAIMVGSIERSAERRQRRERAQQQAAVAAWQQQQAMAPVAPVVPVTAPGTCDTFGATNPNRTPGTRQSVAESLGDSFRERYGGNMRVAVHGADSDTIAVDGLQNCTTQLRQFVERLGAGDYNSSARVLCTAYGFRRITCGIYGADLKVLDLNRDCVCTSAWDCACPRP